MILFLLPTIWVGPFWFFMLLEPGSDRANKWVEGNMLFIGPLETYFVTIFVLLQVRTSCKNLFFLHRRNRSQKVSIN